MQLFPAAAALVVITWGLSPRAAQAPPTQAAAPAQASPQPAAPNPKNDELFAASRTGDVAGVTKALANGADVNAKARYGVTAITFAAGNGHTEVVRLLLDRGADPNVQDTFYRARAVDMALSNGHSAAAMLLMERGSNGGGTALMSGITTKNLPLIKLALGAKDLTRGNVNSGIMLAKRDGTPEIVALLTERLTSFPADTAPRVTVDPAALQAYAGPFRNEANGLTVTFSATGDALSATVTGQPALSLVATSQTSFRAADIDGITFTFSGRGGLIEQALLTQGAQTTVLLRVPAGVPAAVSPATPAPATAASAEPARPIVRGEARPWPAFRGVNAAGNGDGQGAVTEWNAASQTNVKWKTPIPGIANSSPVVWGDRVFVTTAISSARDATFRTGLYGDVKPVDDVSEHTWKMYCLDKGTGKIVWERIAHTGVPKVKRHTKSSQASSTPVTDGKRVVAIFGSVGVLEAWDVNGTQLWKKDIGILDNGWFFDPEFQWGHSSSPIIHGTTVIVQADIQKNSFIAAYDLDSGKEVWRTERDEISTWGTPTIFQTAGKSELVTNGTRIRGYDPATGKLLWTLGPNSEVTVGTPIVGDGLVYVTAGYPPVRPVYAVKPGSSGDITLPKDKTSSDAVAWSNDKEGTYIPTPIFYEGLLYTLGNNGVLTVYDGKSGERLYRARVGGGGSFSASPVAADGRLFFPNEDGDIIVVRAGRTYQELAKNEMKEVVMATPAISDGLIVIRTLGHVYGIGK